MIEIRTFLKQGENFVSPDEFNGPFPDEDYIEGAIELSINHRPLLTRAQWDYVDQLWAYLVSGLTHLQAGKPFKTYFPDQPMEVVLTPDTRNARVTIQVTSDGTVEASTPLAAFIADMAKAARSFFERMRVLLPKESYEQSLNEIGQLEQAGSSRAGP